jgi:hypothetical protein
MRLKEDDTSWKSRSIKRRNYRQAPLTPEEEVPKGHPKRKQKQKQVKKERCKHVWVEVSYDEWIRYRDKHRHYWSYWWHENMDPPYWTKYTTYFVCADCLETKSKIDEERRRYLEWKSRRDRYKT